MGLARWLSHSALILGVPVICLSGSFNGLEASGMDPVIALGVHADWIAGASLGTCSNAGAIWTCTLTRNGGYQGLLVWDASRTCNGGVCSTSVFNVAPPYVKYRDLNAHTTTVIGTTVPIGAKPILLENSPSAPTISGITPNSGSTNGGTVVTITGTGFVAGAGGTIGGSALTNVNVASNTSITGTTGSGTAGASNVVVTNPDGQSATLASTAQLLSNAGFESGSTGWKAGGVGSTTVQNNPTNAHGGNNYADLTAAAGNHPFYQGLGAGNTPYFAVNVGDQISFGGWASRVSGNGSARWTIEATDRNKAN